MGRGSLDFLDVFLSIFLSLPSFAVGRAKKGTMDKVRQSLYVREISPRLGPRNECVCVFRNLILFVMFGKIESKTKRGSGWKKILALLLAVWGRKGSRFMCPRPPFSPNERRRRGNKKKVFREKVAEEPIDIWGRMRYVVRARERDTINKY